MPQYLPVPWEGMLQQVGEWAEATLPLQYHSIMKTLPRVIHTYCSAEESNNDHTDMSQVFLWPGTPAQNTRCSVSWGDATRKRLSTGTLETCGCNSHLAPWRNSKHGSPGGRKQGGLDLTLRPKFGAP